MEMFSQMGMDSLQASFNDLTKQAADFQEDFEADDSITAYYDVEKKTDERYAFFVTLTSKEDSEIDLGMHSKTEIGVGGNDSQYLGHFALELRGSAESETTTLDMSSDIYINLADA